MTSVVFFILGLIAAFVVGHWVGHGRRLHLGRLALPQNYSSPIDAQKFTRVPFDPIARCAEESWLLGVQPEPWRAEMQRVGDRLRAANVRSVVFVHGSFVGNDPFAVARVMKSIAPPIERAVERAIQLFSK